MTDIICPLCGKPNPPDRDECQFCQAPLKTSGFIASPEDQDELSRLFPPSAKPGEGEESVSSLEEAIPDWLKETEAHFLEPPEAEPEAEPERPKSDQVSEQIDALLNQPPPPESTQKPVIDDDWLASLLAEAGVGESAPETSQEAMLADQAEIADEEKTRASTEGPTEGEQQLTPEPVEKPDWLTSLEAGATIKLDEVLPEVEPEDKDTVGKESTEPKGPTQAEVPEWIGKTGAVESPPSPEEAETPIATAELPDWLEALRPTGEVSPTGPVEDVSAADIVTAGPLVGLRGVISAHPSAVRARKPPTYSIKLRVTDEQRARVEMMEALLADEQKSKPLPAQPIITSRNIFRLVTAVVLILPIVWMIITKSQQTQTPQPGNIPGVVDFTQQVQLLPVGVPVLLAFDYEAGFSGEMNIAITTMVAQLIARSAYITLVTTTPSGPALAESFFHKTNTGLASSSGSYPYYTDLGYIPGGTMGLLGLAISPRTVLPYSLDENNVWATAPLNTVVSITDFNAVIVITNDSDTARIWIEQVGPYLQEQDRPLLIVTSAQAEPLIRPYYEATPSQVQGLVAGLAGGLAYGRTVGSLQSDGTWDAFSIGVTASVLIILIGAVAGVVMKMPASGKKKGN